MSTSQTSATIIASLTVLASAGSAAAQCDPTELFPTHTSIAVGNQPNRPAVGDLNNDGHLDVIVPNASNSINVRLGNGDGTFQSVSSAGVGIGPAWADLADFNNDGNLDAVTANQNADTVSIRLGNGDGSFMPHVEYGVGERPWALAVGDFNNDGATDVITANRDSYNMSMLLGNGDGTLQPATNTSSQGRPWYEICAADFNGDGIDDVAVVVEDGVTVSISAGDGTFSSQQTISMGGDPRYLAVGDVNGDSINDLVTTTPFSNIGISISLDVRLGNADGTFGGLQSVPSPLSSRPVSPSIADVNGDGLADIVTANSSDSGVDAALFIGNGDGTFQSSVGINAPGDSTAWSNLADFNEDGSPDVLLINRTIQAFSIHLNQCPFAPTIIDELPCVILATAAGDPVEISVGAGGFPPLTYQWRFDGFPISDDENYTGTDSSTLSVSPKTTTEGTYDVVVTNSLGDTTSSSVVLTVLTPVPSDVNSDGVVDIFDLFTLLGSWGPVQ